MLEELRAFLKRSAPATTRRSAAPGVALNDRYFKQKDLVENYVAAQVRAGAMTLIAAQIGIATDWTKYLAAALGGRLPSTNANP